MIGTAAGAYLLLLGRVAGISGLLAKTLGMTGDGGRRVQSCFWQDLPWRQAWHWRPGPCPCRRSPQTELWCW
jgi:hypothetical protein